MVNRTDIAAQEEDVEEDAVLAESDLTEEEKETYRRMMEVGVFYGRSKSRTNPLMREHILTTRSGFEVIDVENTLHALRDLRGAVEKAVGSGGIILFVGTSPASKGAIKEVAGELGAPFITERWLGGTLTNFKSISGRVHHLKKLREDKKSGKLEKYTKKEQLDKEKELEKLSKFFGGIENMERLPSLVFIADLNDNKIAAREARQRGIPVAAIANTDTNPTLVKYPIPANDKSTESVALIMNIVKEMIINAPRTAKENEKEQVNVTDGTN